jgi:hypothetical protein
MVSNSSFQILPPQLTPAVILFGLEGAIYCLIMDFCNFRFCVYCQQRVLLAVLSLLRQPVCCEQGTKEGGVADNTTYYVFTHGKDGSVEAFPISDWYNFVPIQR